MTDSVCPLPTKQVDEQYKTLISQYREIGPQDESFKQAIEELMKYTPSSATKALMQCKMKGGRKSRKMRRGGAPTSKKACYIKALGKITMGVAGLGAAGYYYLMPFVTSATGSPCAGFTDQAFGYVGSWFDPTLSCAYRQKAFDDMTMNYITNIAKLTGISVGTAILKAPKAFKSILKYLAAKECPDLFDNYSLEDLKKDLSSEPLPASVAPSQAQDAPPPVASSGMSQVEPQYDPSYFRQESEQYEQYYEAPEETIPSRRSSRRTRRGGRKQRKRKTKRTGKKLKKSSNRTRRTKHRYVRHRR